MNNTALPTRFIDERDINELDESYAEAIQDAICRGEQLSCHHEGELETCVTRFIDPWTQETRFALEVWHRTSKQMYDYATEGLARGAQVREDNSLGLA